MQLKACHGYYMLLTNQANPGWLTSSIQDSSELVTNKTTKHTAHPKKRRNKKPHKLMHTYSNFGSSPIGTLFLWRINRHNKYQEAKDSDYQKLWHHTFSTRSL